LPAAGSRFARLVPFDVVGVVGDVCRAVVARGGCCQGR